MKNKQQVDKPEPFFAGLIRVGDRFTWTPYGHPRRGRRTWARIEVTDITVTDDGDIHVWAARCNSIGETEDPDFYNDIGHFRDMVGEHDPITGRVKNWVSQVTSENP